MIPIGDDNPTKRIPIVTIALIIIDTVLFVWDHVIGPGAPHALLSYTLVPCTLLDVCNKQVVHTISPSYVTIFTHMFLHGSWSHLIGNMVFLWIFGNNVEDVMGHIRYALLFVFWGLMASLAHIVTDVTSYFPMLGASGAIAGVLGAYAVLFPQARVRIFVFTIIITVITVPAGIVLGIWFAYQVLLPQPGVAVMAHIGGFVAGVLTVLIFGKQNLLRAYRRLPYRYNSYR